jgi:hypothetical protein
MLATAIDMALAGSWAWHRRPRLSEGAASATEPSPSDRLLALARPVVREQLGSPGERLTGLRTVDRRTGRRVQLWRTLLIVATAVAGDVLARRARRLDAEQQRERVAFHRELGDIYKRHRDDPQAREAEVARVLERVPKRVRGDLKRTVGPVVASGLLVWLLRRRLAPTVVIDARARRVHSP